MFRTERRIRCAVLAAIPLLGFVAPAHAADTTWTFNGDGNWNEGSKWNNGEPTDNSFNAFIDDGDTAVTVTLNVDRNINDLHIGSDDRVSIGNNRDLTLSGNLFNSGTLSIDGVNSTTRLLISNGTTFSGSGTVLLNFGGDQISGSGTFTNSAGHTIAGFGNIGANAISLTNNGLVTANSTGNVLFMDPNSNGNSNSGTFQATNGGILQLSGNAGGGMTNTGTIEAVGANSEVQLLTGMGVSGGTFQSSSGGVIRTNASQTVSISDVTNTGTFIGDNNSDTIVAGVITNNGTMILNSVNSQTRFVLSGSVTFAGSGTVVMTGPNSAIGGGGTLVNGSTHTIEGVGNLGQNANALVNNGVVNANVTGSVLFMDPNSNGNSNSGTFQATNGGILQLSGNAGGGLTNTGTIEAVGANSEVQLLSGMGVSGGTFQSSNGGVIRTDGGNTVSISDITNTGTFIDDNNADTQISGLITNNGTMILNSTNSTTRFLVPSGSATFAGSGQVVLSGGNAALGGGGTLTNSATHTIDGQGNVGQNGLALINNGLIDANVNTAGLTIDPGAGGGAVNNGTFRASNGGILVLTGNAGGGFTNTGTIAALTDSEVQLTGGISLGGGTLATTGTGDIRNISGQTVTLTDLTNTGNFITDNNARTQTAGTITNSGTFQINAVNSTTDLTLAQDTTLTGGGTVILSTPGGSAQIDGGHVLTIDNQTIQGFGNLGANSASVINNGLVNANVNGQTLVVERAPPASASSTTRP